MKKKKKIVLSRRTIAEDLTSLRIKAIHAINHRLNSLGKTIQTLPIFELKKLVDQSVNDSQEFVIDFNAYMENSIKLEKGKLWVKSA